MINAVLTFKIKQIQQIANEKEAKLKSVKLYNTLLDSLSHELRTPISAIIGTTDTLQNHDIKLTDEQKELYKSTLSLPTCLELGTQEPTIILLISSGVTRSVAIQLNRVYKKNTTKDYRENNDIWKWLSNKSEITELKPIYNRYLKRLKILN